MLSIVNPTGYKIFIIGFGILPNILQSDVTTSRRKFRVFLRSSGNENRIVITFQVGKFFFPTGSSNFALIAFENFINLLKTKLTFSLEN